MEATKFTYMKVEGKLYKKLYGIFYVSNFKDDIQDFFNKGKLDSSNKMNAVQMRYAISAWFPNCITIPSLTEIQQEIGKIFSKSKDTTSTKRIQRGTIQDKFILHKTSKTLTVNWYTI